MKVRYKLINTDMAGNIIGGNIIEIPDEVLDDTSSMSALEEVVEECIIKHFRENFVWENLHAEQGM